MNRFTDNEDEFLKKPEVDVDVDVDVDVNVNVAADADFYAWVLFWLGKLWPWIFCGWQQQGGGGGAGGAGRAGPVGVFRSGGANALPNIHSLAGYSPR